MTAIESPTAFRPASLWSFADAQAAHGALVAELEPTASLASDADECRWARALLAVLRAHAPERETALTQQYAGEDPEDLIPEHAVCSRYDHDDDGDLRAVGCWGDGNRDAATPWPCPGARPVLAALGVSRG